MVELLCFGISMILAFEFHMTEKQLTAVSNNIVPLYQKAGKHLYKYSFRSFRNKMQTYKVFITLQN